MITVAEISALIEQYSKHEWVPRRAKLKAASIDIIGAELAASFPEVTIVESKNEALWFSRRSLPDREAWEIRRLSGSPFALVTVVEDALGDDEREEFLSETERQMFDGSHPEPMSH